MNRNYKTGGLLILIVLIFLFNTTLPVSATTPNDTQMRTVPTDPDVNNVKCQKGWIGNSFPDLLKYCYKSHGPYKVTVINAMTGGGWENTEAVIDDENLIVVTKTIPPKPPKNSSEKVCQRKWVQYRAESIDICFYSTQPYFIVVIDHSNGDQWHSFFSIPGPEVYSIENNRGKVTIEAEFGYLPVAKGTNDPNFLTRTKEEVKGRVTALYSYYGMLLAVTTVDKSRQTVLIPLTDLNDYPSISGKWPEGFPATMKMHGLKPRKGKIKNQTLYIP